MAVLMNYQFFELYRTPDRVWGQPIDPKPFNQLRGEYDSYFHLNGRTANFFLVTSDDTISRTDAITFATTIANGQFKMANIDFSEWNNWKSKRLKK